MIILAICNKNLTAYCSQR